MDDLSIETGWLSSSAELDYPDVSLALDWLISTVPTSSKDQTSILLFQQPAEWWGLSGSAQGIFLTQGRLTLIVATTSCS